ncbi:MAG: excinuclease ABC subunit UvrA [Patescibacteria group bacterium]
MSDLINKAYEYNKDKTLPTSTVVPNPHDFITVKGAKEHNLKDVTVVIPKNNLVVFSGLSGSGKSSLVFDTIYAEGQRRYVESLSSYARQFLGLKEKPAVDSIDGLSPAISIDQKSTSQNPRSTVGTITEIYDYMRLLFAKAGHQHCHECGAEIIGESVTSMCQRVLKLKTESAAIFLAPIVVDQKGWHKQVILDAEKNGFSRLRIDEQIILIEEAKKVELNKQSKHTIEVVVDRFTINEDNKLRIIEALETALKHTNGRVNVLYFEEGEQKTLYLNKNKACPNGHTVLSDLEPRQFSFNSPHGACPHCTGLGTVTEVDPDLVVPNESLTINEGCLRPVSRMSISGGWLTKIFETLAKKHNFSLDTPWRDLSQKARDIILYGDKTFEGVIVNLNRRYKESTSESSRKDIESYMNKRTCSNCGGSRLRPESLAVSLGDKNIAYVCNLPVNECYEYFKILQNPENDILTNKQKEVSRMILKEIVSRLKFLVDVGLSYLTLMRSADTLSGGEAQRIRLATQIGSGLTGVLYILDEPSIGLHQKDNQKLLDTLKHLKNLGNTVLVVEHDEDTMRESDFIFDIGPKAGKYGGNVVAYGTPEQLMKNNNSPTGRFLAGKDSIPLPKKRRVFPEEKQKFIEILGATENNLKNVDIKVPLRKFVTVTGVSGSGKSTLINDILSNYLMNYFYDSRLTLGKHKEIIGIENIDKPIIIDQSPIGRTPRSNPATYTNLFTPIRELFSSLPESVARGYSQGRFSFNVPGGRCETCEGDGVIKVEMNFLPDVYVTCEDCKGKRYNRETLEVKYQEKSIADILDMTIDEALGFFENHTVVKRRLQTLQDVGLGYIHLGQPATTLSGGEAQRIKLATELSKVGTGNTLYILDEPTTGLHPLDVKMLLDVLHKLVDKGNSVLVIEHNLDVIKTSDWLIDLGPEGGSKGGSIVGFGTPEELAEMEESFTGHFLKPVLKKK